MFATIRAMFARKPAAPAIRPVVDDVPAHKGFRAVARFCNGSEIAATFPTLAQAQSWATEQRQSRTEFVAGVKARWAAFKPARTSYRIHNLETGRFAPVYEWRAA